MSKASVLQVRFPEQDLDYLRSIADTSGETISAFIRNSLEPTIVSAKIANLATLYDNIERIVLFGSMARGDHDETSDIDLAISFLTSPKWTGVGNLAEFLRNAEILTGRHVDYVSLRSCPYVLADEILRDGKVIYEK